MKKKLIPGLLITAFLFSIVAPTGFAQKKSFSFNVTPNQNSGVAYSAPNPKDDSEQKGYIYTTKHNIISTDKYYYNIKKSASISSISYTGYIRVTPSNAKKIVKSYGNKATKGQKLILQADTDVYSVYSEGYWYS
ncbi:hypothetical protein [Niallia taxi]|uniref:hypothetical protein n=2 Tax=Niallia taxi TaxID=2499688 RepID=UPI0011A60BDF